MATKKVGKAEKKTAKKKAAAKRFSDKQKESRLARYRELLKSGETSLKAAKQVGVSYATLLKWEKGAGGKQAQGRSRAAARSGGLAIVMPEGLRIEGLSTADLLRVIKELK